MSDGECNGRSLYDSYASCLAKTLCYVSTPMTIGLYAPWGSGVNCLLKNVEKQMKIEALNREEKELKRFQERPRGASVFEFISLLWHLLFLKPQITERHAKRKNVRFIFIQFSAWQFAGSDKLWAGLITTLCEDIKNQFGCIPTGIVRTLGHQDTVLKTTSDREWVSKRILGIPVWLIFTLLLLLAIVLGIVILMNGFSLGDMKSDYTAAAEGVGFGLIGISTLMTMKHSVMMGKNICVSQKEKMQTLMNKSDFSSQLGFMNDVKQEVKVLTNFIHYMEVFERRKIRVVMKIMSLDRCTPDKIVGVLDAMNILLSDPEAPFISVLAVDPSIIVDCVEKSSTLKGVGENGYCYLNRIVSLPFSVPKMDTQTKLKFLQQAIDGKNALLDDNPLPTKASVGRFRKNASESNLLINVSVESDQPSKQRDVKVSAGSYIQQAYQCTTDINGQLLQYIEENFLQMKRIINITSVMIGLMVERNISLSSFPPQRVVAWIVLASNWPCRLSWIWQCWEDAEQRKKLNEEKDTDDNMLLWTVYEQSLERFMTIRSQIENLLAMDGDPEVFEAFLSESYKFTVNDAKIITPCTINLDRSLKRKMELLLARNL
ncbi:NTPase KAP family P-loop domain-containing protein 1 [Leucoraja erinacea]|uniref:NTPase KAP family P-loop domain-containing protein 1 n=1 Tax=Leucoraja erinaceus TaxID=7782 RepID=UPI002453B198|nr:NTPase KAP family P-loop domain-containing protein 1 [Leucoraja erinacea]